MKLTLGKNSVLCNYLVIDVGGTSTKTFLYTKDGELIDNNKFKSIHLNNVTENEAVSVLADIINHYNNIEKVCIGYAGYGLSTIMREKINRICDLALKDINYIVVNDIDLAFKTAFGDQVGILVSSGTGSIAFCNANYKYERRGGYGYLLGDEGSGYWIGRELIRLFLDKQSKNEADKLYNTLDKEFRNIFHQDIVSAIYCDEHPRKIISQVSKLAENYSLKFDEVKQIFINAGKSLAQLANDFDIDENILVSVNGSIFNNEVVKESFKKCLKPNYQFIEAEYTLGYGGYLLIREDNENELCSKDKKCL